MTITIYRPRELYNKPARHGQPGQRGKLGIGRTCFYEEIEPRLEKVKLGPRAIGYTARSIDRLIEQGIAEAIAERGRRPAQRAAKSTAAEAER